MKPFTAYICSMKIPFAFALLLLIYLVDVLSFRYYFIIRNKPLKRVIKYFLWSLIPSALFLAIILIVQIIATRSAMPSYRLFFNSFAVFILLYIPRLVVIIFGIAGELPGLLGWRKIRRFIVIAGTMAGVVISILLIRGMIQRDKTEINHCEIEVKNLPASFDGFSILQVSDWHLGSYGNDTNAVSEAIALINQQDADMIVFTGDIVNNQALEVLPFIPVFRNLKTASYGNYAVLGNHDFSDYSQWESEEAKKTNNEQICRFLETAGFKVLRNQSIPLTSSTDTLWISGVDNWGLPPFKQYGNLADAVSDLPHDAPIILLSHNPSHWKQEVLNHPGIFLTLAGHTHGMQMGILMESFQWSPVRYLYPEWAGLYQNGSQHLNVNRGIGFIGFSARVGMPAEITLLTLRKK